MVEEIVETKICAQCEESFSITAQDIVLYHKLIPRIGGVEYPLPHPTRCPDCRQQRRVARRNERKLYHGTCDLTGKRIISLYSPDKKFPVYHYQAWRSDARDPMNYAMEYDPKQTFFSQFENLFHQVPRISTYNKRTENTEYGNNVIEDKDCYLLFITYGNVNCYYGFTIGYCKNCVDCLWTISCHNCYQCTKTQNCYECFYCFNAQDCFNSQYLIDCFGVDSSAYCIGLRNKKYHFLNKSYNKSEYKEILERLAHDTEFLLQTKKEFTGLRSKVPVNASFIEQTEDSSGDYLNNCKNCIHCFDTILAQDSRYCYDTANAMDCMDQYLWWAVFTKAAAQLAYECENTFNSSSMYFCSSVAFQSNNVFYSDTCHCCTNCFGCVGMRHKQYCILNTQYTQEEYEKIVPQIIERMEADWEWGEFFPSHMSLFWYNETEAQVYYPLSREEVIAKGWKRHEEVETKIPEGCSVIQARDLPPIQEATDDILSAVIICEVTGKPFKLIKQELEFYRKYLLPLPTKHPDQRHLERLALKTPRKLFERNCMKCWSEIRTGYAPERPETIYCSACYYKEIYG